MLQPNVYVFMANTWFWHCAVKWTLSKYSKCYWSGNISIVLGGWFCFIFSKKILGVFRACCFLLWFLKKTGACSGRVLGVLLLLHFVTKILGRVPGVFSVFQCVQCVVSTDPRTLTDVKGTDSCVLKGVESWNFVASSYKEMTERKDILCFWVSYGKWSWCRLWVYYTFIPLAL